MESAAFKKLTEQLTEIVQYVRLAKMAFQENLTGKGLKPMLTNDDAAKMLGVSKRTLQRMRSENRIDFIKIGNQCRYQVEAIERMVEERTIAKETDYLYDLPHWDGKDRILALARTVPCNNPYWAELFHRWFLNMVAHWRGNTDKKYANSVSPLLVGAQGTRKSTFCRSIVPPELRAYYTDSIDFSRKRDAELYLNRFALINIDEFDQISSTQQGFLKHILQKPVVNVRKPYANAVLEMRRYASFIATSNQKDLLTDPSGSRRFICIEVTEAIDTNRPIDYNQLYAQAMHELDHGERYWFDQSDERIMTENNHDFEQIPPEEQLFYHYFRVAGNDEEGEWLSSAEILNRLRRYSAIPLSTKRVNVFGRILQKHEVPSRRTRFGTLYHVVECKRQED